ncbi:hypothetical protein [Nocardioides sp.]|uniref:hypothetical protein n=1 Tax=Nocardioides sp. TaxID=35761 RepID=UPI00273514A8|nr:hypothetical protein [Nocardioides sp.]MDP3890272.1 hypothetical protein [Nocardioides sp.]
MRNYKPGPGRRSKGARKAFMTRLPHDVAAIVEAEAAAREISLSEYLAIIAAQAHGVETEMPSRKAEVSTQSSIEELGSVEELSRSA